MNGRSLAFLRTCHPARYFCLVVGIVFSLSAVAGWAQSPVRSSDKTTVDHAKTTKFLKTYCIECHGPDAQESDLRLDQLSPDFSHATTASTWIEVMDKMNLGEMPPEGATAPSPAEVASIAGWIATELRRAERTKLSAQGRVILRRMNRAEYANTVRDLLKLNFLPGESLSRCFLLMELPKVSTRSRSR